MRVFSLITINNVGFKLLWDRSRCPSVQLHITERARDLPGAAQAWRSWSWSNYPGTHSFLLLLAEKWPLDLFQEKEKKEKRKVTPWPSVCILILNHGLILVTGTEGWGVARACPVLHEAQQDRLRQQRADTDADNCSWWVNLSCYCKALTFWKSKRDCCFSRCCCIDRQIVVGTNSSLWAKKHLITEEGKEDIAAICILNSEDDVYTCLFFFGNEIHVCISSSGLLMFQVHHHTSSFLVPSILQLEIFFPWEKT